MSTFIAGIYDGLTCLFSEVVTLKVKASTKDQVIWVQ